MTRSPRGHRLLLSLLLAFAAGAARADHPLVTEDGDILDREQCKVESGYARERETRG